MSDDAGCAAVAVVLLAVIILFVVFATNKGAYYADGYREGRSEQFCIDHGGAWDRANTRCLAKADTITVQVPK